MATWRGFSSCTEKKGKELEYIEHMRYEIGQDAA
jgi:hypothetical protein